MKGIRLDLPSSSEKSDGDKHTSSPTDSMMSPCSKKLMRTNKNKLPSKLGEQVAVNTAHDDRAIKITRKSISLNLADVPCPVPPQMRLILGSSSSSRKKIFDELKWNYTVMSPDIDEKAIRHEDILQVPRLIAVAKAEALVNRLWRGEEDEFVDICTSKSNQDVVILTADQVVLFGDSELREKPVDENEAKRFLSSYSKSSVTTVSAVVATHLASGAQSVAVETATAYWDAIPADIVSKVVARGEIFSSAGGFRIEDPDLNPLILRLEGTVDSIMGLPVEATVRVLSDVVGQIAEGRKIAA